MTPPTKIDFLNVNDLISLTNLPGLHHLGKGTKRKPFNTVHTKILVYQEQSESLDQHLFK